MGKLGKGPQRPGFQASVGPGWRHADNTENCAGQAGGQESDSHEGGTAEDAHSNSARQVAGLLATAVPEVEVVQGLEVVRISLQMHLA